MPEDKFLSNDELARRRELRRQNREKYQKRRRLILAGAAIVLIAALVFVIRGCTDKKTNIPVESEPVWNEQTVSLPLTEDAAVKICAVGDITVSEELLQAAVQKDGSYDFSGCFAAVSAYTMAADLTVGNLELNFCGTPYAGRPDYRAPESLAAALSAIGFDVLQTANSVSIQNGINGLENTILTLDAAGIDHLGTYRSREELASSKGVVLKTVNNIRIAFIGFTKGVGNLALPDGADYAVDLLYTDYFSDYGDIAKQAILDRIDCAKQFAPDAIIAMVHWGSEYDNTVTETQEKILKLMTQNGVDVILGSHSHLVSTLTEFPVTLEDGTEKTCFAAYSLGNFFAPKTQSNTQESILLNFEITKSATTGAVSIQNVSYLPLYILAEESEEKTAYEVLPIRSVINSSFYQEYTAEMTDAIANLRAATESDYDCGK